MRGTHIGVAGWAYDDWVGPVYPATPPAGFDRLAFLAHYVDCIEINSSFYRPPSPHASARWVERVTPFPDFLFTVKLWQRFTHQRAEKDFEGDARWFRESVAPLYDAGKCGALLMQFPWSFRRTRENAAWLKRLCEEFRDLRPAIELRHASWNVDSVMKWCGAHDASLCAIDQPMFDNSLDQGAFGSGPVGYVRLHGRRQDNWFRKDAATWERYDYLYSEEELDPWLARIREIAGGAEQTFVITNNHYRGQALANALDIRSALRQESVSAPSTLRHAFPELQDKTIALDPAPGEDETGDLFG